MNPALRVAAFGATLAALFGVAAGVGAATGASAPAGGDHGGTGHAMAAGDAMAAAGHAGDEHAAAPGLAVAANGLRLIITPTRFTVGHTVPLRLRIADARGRTVRAFDVEHTKRLHLAVVRRDLQRFQHLHPAQAADGSWSVPLRLRAAGTYRVYADVVPHGGTRTVLGTDLFVAGGFTPQALPAPAAHAVTDGYAVRLPALAPRAGVMSRLSFTVTRDGVPVAVQSYLGADGHLVTLRAGDLAYLHTHPEAGGPRGRIAFMTSFPTAGSYRLFLQFRHAGRVHTVAFTREVR